jgi:dipeptidyl aminopeptidase/acylaminoacyl peptidase
VKKLFDGNFEKFSPSNYIREGLPPSIIFHGKSDKTIPIEIIEKFSNDMIERGNMVKFLKWDNKGHQFYRWDKEAYPEVISELIKFIKEN